VSTPPSQPGLENLPSFRIEKKKTFVEDGSKDFGTERDQDFK
jgi:hypothetical protein